MKTSMRTLMSVNGLFKAYGERVLLDIRGLEIPAGAAIALTGMNGAGKSTLLRILAGLDPAEIGAASFDGKAVNLAAYPRALREAIVYVHQHPLLFATSVADNIAYGLRARGLARGEIAAQVKEAMAWAGVLHLRDDDPRRLSGGEKQRIALARAKILQPRLLLLDEPTSSLDGAAREQVMALIPRLLANGASVLMACHDRDLIHLPGVMRWKLRNGRLEYKRLHVVHKEAS